MICPKCQSDQEDGAIECARCGIVFAKFDKYRISEAQRVRRKTAKPEGALLSVTYQASALHFWGRALVLSGMIWVGWSCVFSPIGPGSYAMSSFLHNINLPFHEAGHVLFRWFGSFLHSLGGSIGQLLMPAICLAVLLIKTRDAFGAAVCLWWFGENFIDLAPYINDARSLGLPLLGGNFGHSAPYGFHDWEFILTESGLLRFDHAIAVFIHMTGTLLIASAVAWAAILLTRQRQEA